MPAPKRLSYMNEGKEYAAKTTSGIFSLKLLNGLEPNYGRQVWETCLSINGQDVTEKYFGWNSYVEFDLRKYQPLSVDQKYFFVPKEGQGFLIETSTLKKIELPTIQSFFLGNSYHQDYLLCAYIQRILLVNLKNLITNQIGFFENLYNYNLFVHEAYFERGDLFIVGAMSGDLVRYRYNFDTLTVEIV